MSSIKRTRVESKLGAMAARGERENTDPLWSVEE
jgi:hypothetical protein